MKKLMFAVGVAFAMGLTVVAQEAAPKACCAGGACEIKPAAAAPVDAKAEKAAKAIERKAKALGVSVEEYNKMTKEERKAKLVEVTAKREEAAAKRLNVSVEDYKKMSKDERKAKLAEVKAAKKAEAKKAAKAKKPAAPAAEAK